MKANPTAASAGLVSLDPQGRYKRGLEKLDELDRDADRKVIESLRDIAPDFVRYLIESSFDDIYS